MKVILMAKTQLTEQFTKEYSPNVSASDNEKLALIAIRNCYSPLKPSEILHAESERYFGGDKADGKRLFKQIANSKHTSTMEHIHFAFSVEDISRAALAQLTRHRHYGFSVKSQRYVKYGSGDKSGGFNYVRPASVIGSEEIYDNFMHIAQETYDRLREAGVPAEDARNVLPNAATTHIVMSGNLRAILEFYGKRQEGRGAQAEIAELAEKMRKLVQESGPWTEHFFEVQ